MEARCATGTGEIEAGMGDKDNPIQLALWSSGLDTGDWRMPTLVCFTYGMKSRLVSSYWALRGLISTRFNVKVENTCADDEGVGRESGLLIIKQSRE